MNWWRPSAKTYTVDITVEDKKNGKVFSKANKQASFKVSRRRSGRHARQGN